MGNSKSTDAAEKPSQPGSQVARREEGQPQNQTIMKQKEKIAPVTDAGNYLLDLSAGPQNGQYTFSDDVDKFYSQIVIEAPHFEMSSRPAVDVVAVLDVSGSMGGNKISLVRKSMRRLVRSMGNRDRVAFVTFDTGVNVLMNFCTMDEDNKQRAFDLITHLREGSSTNLCGGVTIGVQHLLDNRVNEVAAILLFTDGQANIGIRTPKGIVEEVLKLTNGVTGSSDIAKWSVNDVQSWLRKKNLDMYSHQFMNQGVDGGILLNDINEEHLRRDLRVSGLHVSKFMREITALRESALGAQREGEVASGQQNPVPEGFRLHTFGFGSNHNTTLLESLAESFDGMYYFMRDEDAIKAGFANCLGGLLSTVAQNIDISLQFSPEISNFKIHKDDVTTDSNGRPMVSFADLQSEEKRHILVSCNLPALKKACEDYLLYEVTCTYDNVISCQKSTQIAECQVNRNGSIDEYSEAIGNSRNRVQASDAMKEAQALGDLDNLPEARARLQLTIDTIESSLTGKTVTGEKLKEDLKTAITKFKDRVTYKNDGDYYITQNFMCLKQERACNFEADYQAQMEYNTGYKAQMCEEFERADSMDSICSLEDFPPCDLNQSAPSNVRALTPPISNQFDYQFNQNSLLSPTFASSDSEDELEDLKKLLG